MKEELIFRSLRADEVELRVQQKFEASGNNKEYDAAMYLLYKDARCDMNVLDETVGAFNWKREHSRDNANCVVSIWSDRKSAWVSKEDTGTESNTEKEKGLASDSFKRACFNWGIGRELYTAPKIKIAFEGKEKTYGNIYDLHVKDMAVRGGCITKLIIVDGNDKVRYSWAKPISDDDAKKLLDTAKSKEELKSIIVDYNLQKNTTIVQHATELAKNLK